MSVQCTADMSVQCTADMSVQCTADMSVQCTADMSVQCTAGRCTAHYIVADGWHLHDARARNCLQNM